MLILSLCSIFRYYGTGSFCGQTLGPLPLGLAQAVIIRQQSLRQNCLSGFGHLLGHQCHGSCAAAPQGRGRFEHTRHTAVFIIAQRCAITNKKQGLFAIFYKLGKVCHGAGIVLQQALVGGQIKRSAVHLRAAGIQCFDTVFTDLDDNEGFEAEVRQNKAMGFDGKSLINPKQIRLVHQIFAPTEKEVAQAEAMVSAFREAAAAGIGVFTVNGKMVDVAFIPGAERTLRLAKACGMYEGDLV